MCGFRRMKHVDFRRISEVEICGLQTFQKVKCRFFEVKICKSQKV